MIPDTAPIEDIEIKIEDVQEVLRTDVLSHLTPLALEKVKVVALWRLLKEERAKNILGKDLSN